jgi:type I restriction enzyme S subunit
MKNNQKSELYFGHTLDLSVPSHWEIVSLDEVLERIIGGGTPSKSNPDYWNGGIPWLTIKDMRTSRPKDAIDYISEVGVSESATNLIPANTVIMATRIGLGKVVRVPYAAAINQDLKALITLPEIDKGYLEFWLLSISNYLQSIGSGTTVKGIRLEQVRSLPFPLAPISEQKRIVAEIEKQFSRLDKAVTNLQRVKANLKRYKAAVLKAAVEGKLTEEWRKQNPDVEPASKLLKRILAERRTKWEVAELAKMKAKGKVPKDDAWKKKYKDITYPYSSDLPAIPDSWVWVTPAQIASSKDYALAIGPFGSNLKVMDYRTEGVPLVFVRNIRTGIFKGENTKYVSHAKAEELKAHQVKEGDILITKMGDPPGDSCLYSFGSQRAVITADCLKWTLSENLESQRFFVHATNSQLVKSQILAITKGVAQLKISLSRFRDIAYPFPPGEEQKIILHQIESKMAIIGNFEKILNLNLKRAESLRQSILQKAFSGELVAAESTDEPASILFERIKKTTTSTKRKKSPSLNGD